MKEPFEDKQTKAWAKILANACWQHEGDIGVKQSTTLRDMQRKIKQGIIPKYKPNRGRLDNKYFKK